MSTEARMAEIARWLLDTCLLFGVEADVAGQIVTIFCAGLRAERSGGADGHRD